MSKDPYDQYRESKLKIHSPDTIPPMPEKDRQADKVGMGPINPPQTPMEIKRYAKIMDRLKALEMRQEETMPEEDRQAVTQSWKELHDKAKKEKEELRDRLKALEMGQEETEVVVGRSIRRINCLEETVSSLESENKELRERITHQEKERARIASFISAMAEMMQIQKKDLFALAEKKYQELMEDLN